MGIKHFFKWFRTRFSKQIFWLRRDQTFADVPRYFGKAVDTKDQFTTNKKSGSLQIDHLMIDMNGIFHKAAQKIYQYGDCQPRPGSGGTSSSSVKNPLRKQLSTFQDTCNTIEKIVGIVRPSKKIILCVDGVAPFAKQQQQRQRRFISAQEQKEQTAAAGAKDTKSNASVEFDRNCISPGTKYMDYLTKYVDWYIRKRMSDLDSKNIWRKVEVVLSNEKVPGEGEHNCLNFIRKHGKPQDTYCLYGVDADLFMLSLGTHLEQFFILRENTFFSDKNSNSSNSTWSLNSNRTTDIEHYVIDIGQVHRVLESMMKWENTSVAYNGRQAVDDFMFMCFLVGNDFLPNIPSVEIIEGGIDFMMNAYRNICSVHGHLTENIPKIGLRFRPVVLKAFMDVVGQVEQKFLETKLGHKLNSFPDPILEKHTKPRTDEKGQKIIPSVFTVDIAGYREEFYRKNLPHVLTHPSVVCHQYLEGLQWVLSYYTQGVPNWRWKFPYHYAPFASTLAEHVTTFQFPQYPQTHPVVPFIQLLSILPPLSSNLLPSPLDTFLTSAQSPLAEYCPKQIEVDLSGKRQKWEGVVRLPTINVDTVEDLYLSAIARVEEQDRRRNVLGKAVLYTVSVGVGYSFRSFYGDFDCHVRTVPFEL